MNLPLSPSGSIVESRNVVRDQAAVLVTADTVIVAGGTTPLGSVTLKGTTFQEIWAVASFGLLDTSGVANPSHLDLLFNGVVVASQPLALLANGHANATVRCRVAVPANGNVVVSAQAVCTGSMSYGATVHSSFSLEASLVDPT